MASQNNGHKAPPRKTEDITYANWKKEIKVWQFNTKVEEQKQGGALFLSLEGKPRQTVLAEVEVDHINSADGVKKIFECLDKFYKKDEIKCAYTAFDEFIQFKRSPKTSLKDYLIDFNLKYHKIVNYNMPLQEGVLAYLLLNSANMSEDKKEICRATCPTLTFDNMRQTIEKVGISVASDSGDKQITFSPAGQENVGTSVIPAMSRMQIKQEPVFVANADQSEVLYDFDDPYESNDEEGVFYGNNHHRMGKFRYPTNRQSTYSYGGSNKKVFVKRNNYSQGPKLNPCDPFGNIMTCKYCYSWYHLVNACPDCPEHLKRNNFSNRNSHDKPFSPSHSKHI